MKIGIVSDHRGYNLKKELIELLTKEGYFVNNYGTDSEVRIDYPDYAFILGEKIILKEVDLGIAICGTGIGMSIAMNKVKGVICAKIGNEVDAFKAKEHNNANALAFSSEKSAKEITKLIKIFISTKFLENAGYEERINKIKLYEESNES